MVFKYIPKRITCSVRVWVCSFRNVSMVTGLNPFLWALETFQWMFTPHGWRTSKVIICSGGGNERDFSSPRLLVQWPETPLLCFEAQKWFACSHVTFPRLQLNLPEKIDTLSFLSFTGEDVKVRVEIINSSSRPVKPKFVLYEKSSFLAQGRRRVYAKDLLKKTADECSGRKTVTMVIHLPGDLTPSILNSSIIKLEYKLKVNCIFLCSKDCRKVNANEL